MKTILLVHPHNIAFKDVIVIHKTYNDNVSRSIYLQKLAVLPVLNVKSLVYLNKSCTATFCRRAYMVERKKISNIYFCRITIPTFQAVDLKGVTTTGLHL